MDTPLFRGATKPPLGGAATLFTAIFLKFQVCQLVNEQFVLRQEYFYLRQDQIAGYETFPGHPGEQCIRIVTVQGFRIYIKAGPTVINTINRGSRPR